MFAKGPSEGGTLHEKVWLEAGFDRFYSLSSLPVVSWTANMEGQAGLSQDLALPVMLTPPAPP